MSKNLIFYDDDEGEGSLNREIFPGHKYELL
jgi:hypothetical protein